MNESSWTQIASYGTRLEADIARATLEAAGIQVLIHGEQSGIFGPGFQGWAPGGITVAVPAHEADRARAAIWPQP